jgi:hypothetical protein
LPKKHRSMQFVTNMKVADESATWTPGHLRKNLILHYL